ncbi:MAG: sugar ABC transporter substrate-binding protein [Bauldia sp.]|uniref:ABC transporter substrate-binding protein n=1 Tax=Bauldia sp. TaxID=2575872 RepID=UPI001D6E832D|nr:sugar ABC transporter substrate-binding protein [Bauldia sp.]MCB1494198.1 sugar ABC transporter substrate-binding protein [Bauldia sp.]
MKALFTAAAAVYGLMSASAVCAQDITAWVIDGDAEKAYFVQLEEAFNASDAGVTVKLVPIPGYNDAINAATLAGDLPDVIMIDGPNMAAMAWAGTIQPIGDLLDGAVLDDLLPAVRAQGTYGPDEDFYFVSPYDSSVLLWGNRAILESAGIEIPTSIEDAWTAEELGDVLAKLKEQDGIEWPLDVKLNYGAGEWLTYGFSPFIQSAGGDIIDRKTWHADGTINSESNVAVLQTLQDWVNAGYVVPASAGDNKFYGEKTAALSWVGNWMWGAHKEGLGDDLVLIPAPSFGEAGPVSPNGGWGWAVPASTENLDAVGKFLNFAMSTDQVAKYADMTGYIPARASAVPLSARYGEGGEGELFAKQAACCAIVRPVHPAYPVITAAFAGAIDNIMTGTADVKAELDKAAETIDEDIEDNAGYPPFDQ